MLSFAFNILELEAVFLGLRSLRDFFGFDFAEKHVFRSGAEMVLTEFLAVVKSAINHKFFASFAMGSNVFNNVIIAFVVPINPMNNELIHSCYLFLLVSFEHVFDGHAGAVVKDRAGINFDGDFGDDVTEH